MPCPVPTFDRNSVWVNPADCGSIDVFWRQDDRELLVNFPVAPEAATYFGKDAEGNTIAGEIKGDGIRMDLIVWLGHKK